MGQRDFDRDGHRPRHHFTAPTGWLNDANGVCQWDGTYHLFYQYHPDSAVSGIKHWGHASSADLVHWQDLPIALSPGDGPDADGCWSGVLVNDGGVPTFVYSGHKVDRQLPCLAVGDADLLTWKKDLANPVISGPPAELDVSDFRDHCVWREGSDWHQLIAAGIRDVGGAALHYTSQDLRSWTYLGPLLVGDAKDRDPVSTGAVWECPDFFAVRQKHVLVLSTYGEGICQTMYYVGEYVDGKFEPESLQILDYGLRHFYAPQSMTDESGRRIAFGWLQEARPDSAAVAAGWSGVMSLPRELDLGPDGLLVQAPVAEVASLRGASTEVESTDLQAGKEISLRSVNGDQLDIEAQLLLDEDAVVELVVRRSPGGSERTVIALDRQKGELRLDRSRSSQDPDLDLSPHAGRLPFGPDGRVDLRVLLDRSAIEVFANGRALTTRVYPTDPSATGVALAGIAGSARMERLQAWTMEI